MRFSLSGSSDSTSQEDRFYNLVILFGCVNSFVVVIFNQFSSFPLLLNVLLTILGFFYAGLYYVNRLKKTKSKNKIPFLFAVAITLCISWVFNEGFNGTTPYYFFVAAVFLVFLFELRYSLLIMVSITLLAILLSLFQFYYPQYITPYHTTFDRLFDLIFVFITLLATLGYAVFVFKRNLLNERSIIQKQKQQIEEQYFELEQLHAVLTQVNEEIKNQRDEISRNNRELESSNELLNHQKKAIQSQNKELQELNASRNKFFSIIAHDLKNPFQSIFGFSDLLINDIDNLDKERTLFFVKTIKNSAQHTYELLENLLLWSRSQTGVITFNPSEIRIISLIHDVVRSLQSISLAKNIQVICSVDEQIVIVADRNMLSTILRNLVTNAIKYTLKNGTVTIEVTKSIDSILISVNDNGIGISPENIDKLLSITDKVSIPGTENECGTGLGLILCNEFVQRHGGTITIESVYGKGSTFKVCLPN